MGYVDIVDIRTDGHLLVTMRVRNQYKVPKGTTATIEPNGFFGDMLVALHPDRPTDNYFERDDTIPVGKPTPSLAEVLARVDTLAGHLTALSGTFRKQLVDENGLRDIRLTVSKANRMFDAIEKMANEQSVEFTKTQASLRKAATAIDSARIDSTLRSLKEAGASFKELSARWQATAAHLDSVVTKATSGSGSLAKLMNEPGMHDDVRKAIQRLDSRVSSPISTGPRMPRDARLRPNALPMRNTVGGSRG